MTVDAIAAQRHRSPLLASLAQPTSACASPAVPWLKALRAEAVDRVGVLTIPTAREEAWRFTDLSPLAKQSFHPLRTPTALQPDDVDRFRIDEATTRLVFVDGVHAPQLSSGDAGVVVVGNLPAALAKHPATLESHLGRHATFRDNVFSALNTAFLHDAASIVVPRDTSARTPVHVLFVSTQPGVASHPRVVLVAEAGSAVTLIEDYVALHESAYFTNSVVELALAAEANVEHVRLQRESVQAFHLGRCAVSLARASRYQSVSVALGSSLSRFDHEVVQTADATECRLDGLALIAGNQLADTHTFIDHAKPLGVSRQLHKCVVGGAAHAVFNGKVMVRRGAYQTDSAQSSRNLLLSRKALVDTQPQLEIFADDVKCKHGATVGQLDAEEVFYLRSRGLSDAVARNLLTYAFAAEITARIPIASVRRSLADVVLEQTTQQP